MKTTTGLVGAVAVFLLTALAHAQEEKGRPDHPVPPPGGAPRVPEVGLPGHVDRASPAFPPLIKAIRAAGYRHRAMFALLNSLGRATQIFEFA